MIKYKCFSSLINRRILNLIRFYPLTISDISKILGESRQFIWKCLNQFREADISYKENINTYVVYTSDDKFINQVFELFQFDERPFIKDIKKCHKIFNQLTGPEIWNLHFGDQDDKLISWYKELLKNPKNRRILKWKSLVSHPISANLEEMAKG